MNQLFHTLHAKVNKMVVGEVSLFSKVKRKVDEKFISFPVSSNMILRLIKQNHIQEIRNIKVSIEEETLIITGELIKWILIIPFTIELKPVHFENRKVSFEIIKMTPLNHNWLKNKIFNKPPEVTFMDNRICINLNEIARIKAIPIGTIKKIEVKNNKLLIGIGM